ncbi:MAG TPA: HD-GYP domain-containing protein [Candidatus Wunengus sp. YC61]|uniref:HD-GYP domain-containing protein n=1 Tax=Candidatus Wunengus sp. YC61 TaxID=3367698 RepID=UPI004029A338
MKDEKIKSQFDQIISALSLIMDQFGKHNLLHSRRVAIIATALSDIVMPEKRDIIFYASLLHDVGALVFGEHPLMFPSMHEQKRVPHIFEHPTVGSKIILRISAQEEAQAFIQDHHEWYDGSGYPNGKKGKDICLGAQLIRIADTIDQKMQIYGGYPCTEIYNYLRWHKGREFSLDLWSAIMDLENKDAGAFCIRISDDKSMQWVFSEVIQSVNPYWIVSTTGKEDYMKVILPTFADVIDGKHKYTKKNSQRVAFLSEKIARVLELPDAEIEKIRNAAYLHDIGKVYIPYEILDKPGHLSDQEVDTMRKHVIITMEILDTIEAFRDLSPIAGFHQERYDGKGYPDGLMGDDIPLGARILCVADSVDAMLSDRAYRNGIGVGNAIIQLQRCSGTQFDPEVANVAIGLLSDREFVDELRRAE